MLDLANYLAYNNSRDNDLKPNDPDNRANGHRGHTYQQPRRLPDQR